MTHCYKFRIIPLSEIFEEGLYYTDKSICLFVYLKVISPSFKMTGVERFVLRSIKRKDHQLQVSGVSYSITFSTKITDK